MKKTWYYKLLFSYMPVFFLLVSFLFFIFFQILRDRAQEDTSRIYASINNQMVQTVEQSLRSIDHLMVTMQTRQNTATEFQPLSFFDQTGQPDAYFTFEVIKELNRMRQISPMIHSAYLVRESDGYVLSQNTVSTLDRFPDRPFIESLMQENYSYHWTDKRIFKEFPTSRPETVVSLARKYVTNRGEAGLMVVNVQAGALQRLVSEALDPSSSFLTVTGMEGGPILSVPEDQSQGRTAMSAITSEYTGWKYESGLLKPGSFTLLQAFSGLWIVIALAVVLLGFASILYMTHRNYKPLRLLIDRLDRLPALPEAERPSHPNNQNEFHYIESTLSSLVESFNLFKSQSDLNSGYRKKSIFLEVMNGSRSLANDEWITEMQRHGLRGDFRQAAVLVLSIDKYAEMLTKFTEQDMILYRFIVQNVYMELLQKHGLQSWSEWVNDKEMCGFVYREEERQGELTDAMVAMNQQLLQWISGHLPFTVTVGIGQPTDSVPKLQESYKSATRAVNARAVFGNNRIIGYWEAEPSTAVELYDSLEQIRRLLYSFRMMEPEWRTKYVQLFEQFRINKLKHDDIVNLLHYMAYHLFDQVRGAILNDEMLETNKEIVMDVIEQFETLEDAQEDILGILDKLEYLMAERADKGNEAAVAHQMKQYVDENIANPDLSLVHLSEQFHIPTRNVSSLFKEQLNVKFIDFLIQRRIELAKQLLEDTELSIQEVGHKVGYLNPVSFNRVFKRIVGVPPGDYRKERQS